MLKNYLYGGIFAIFSALLTIPISILMVLSLFSTDQTLSNWNSILVLSHSIIFIFVFLYLKEFSQEKLNINNQAWLFYSIIILGLTINVLTAFIDFEQILSFFYMILISVALTIPLGVLFFVLSQKILKSGVENIAYSKATGYMLATTGLLMATVILSELAVISSILTDIFLALMFIANRKNNNTISDLSPNTT